MIVCLGYYPGDQELTKKLSSWLVDLGPNKGHSVLLARDVRCTGDESIKHNLEAVFDKVEVIDIPERIDGWPEAPNLTFRKVAKHIQYTSKEPWLWLEADVVVLKSGWVEALAMEYAKCGKPFLGDFVNVPNVIPHMSGIGVYPNKITDHAGNITFAADIAWDCYAADQIVPNMAQTRLISHSWRHPAFNNQSEVDNLIAQLKPDCVLWHSDKSGTLIDFLRERRSGKPAIQPQATDKSDSTGILSAGKAIACDIFIKSYPRDYEWLKWCLRSIQKFTTGFRNILVCSPDDGNPAMLYGACPILKEEIGNDNYLGQQVEKMYADTFTDADWIMFNDSDTIFTRPVTPQTYFKDGKPIWMITPMDQAHPDQGQVWRKVMHKFMGKPPEFEYMRRHPFMVPRWLLADLRDFCLKTHGMELKDYVMSQPYREFSEFNVLGFYAYEFYRDKFHWFDTSKHPESEWPVLTVDQRWSHNPIPVEEWEKILGGEENKKTGTDESRIPSPSLPNLLSEVAKHFTSPLAKGRIFKQLKAYPIIK